MQIPVRRLAAAVALLVLLVIMWLLIRFFGPETVTVVNPVRGPAVQAVYATGTVEATVMMPISPRISARLMDLHADEGSSVEKGEVLASLEDEDIRQTIRELQAQVDFAEREYARDAALVKKGAVSKTEFDRSRAELESAKAAVARARAELSYLKLMAPEAGRIIRRDGEEGQLIPANQPVFWLSCCAPLRISAEVDEEDISLVEPGQKVLIRADAFPQETYEGIVQSITPKGDPVARSYRVRIGFEQETPLMIGMTAETNIIVEEKENALLVPSSAVSQDKLWLIEDGKLKQQQVQVGARGPEQTEIISGATEESLVVLTPGADMEEGQAVRPRLKTQDQ